jgi:hypothetical protein
MADLGRAPAGRPMTVVWMVLALVVVGGFLTWLGTASEPTTVVVADDYDDNDVDRNGDAVTTVPRQTLAEDRSTYLGRQIRVEGVESTGRLGDAIFWGELGDMERQVPILVRMDPAVAGGVEIRPGTSYVITGVVQRVTEEQVNEWAEQGEFAGEGEQLQATFADYYIQASAVRPRMR